MKRIISIMMIVMILLVGSTWSVSAESPTISDELITAIREYEDKDSLSKADIDLEYSYEISENKYLVRYSKVMSGQPCIVCEIVMGEYKMTIGQPPIPMILYNGKLYETKVAYDLGIIDYDDLEVMSTFENVRIKKIGWSYEDEFVNNYSSESSDYSYEEIYHYYGGNYIGSSPDWVLAKGSVGEVGNTNARYLKYDDFVLVCKENVSPFTLGYAVFYPPWESYGEGHCFYDLVSDFNLIESKMEGITDTLRELDEAVMMGNCDGDNEISIMDATEIQLVVAQINVAVKLTDERGVEFYFEDADLDGEITVMDATEIQRKIARIE